MAWTDWRTEVPKVAVTMGTFDIKRRAAGQSHVLFRATSPFTLSRRDTNENLIVPARTLSDGSSLPGVLWGALDATPADLLVPGLFHDFAYRKGAKLTKPDGSTRAIDRYQADLLHIAVCRLLRVKKADRARIFYALRLGAKHAFGTRSVGWDGRD